MKQTVGLEKVGVAFGGRAWPRKKRNIHVPHPRSTSGCQRLSLNLQPLLPFCPLQTTGLQCVKTLAKSGNVFLTSCVELPHADLPANIKAVNTNLSDLYANSEHSNKKRKMLADLWPYITDLMDQGKLRALPTETIGGLDAVREGLARLVNKDYSATRLVVHPQKDHSVGARSVAA